MALLDLVKSPGVVVTSRTTKIMRQHDQSFHQEKVSRDVSAHFKEKKEKRDMAQTYEVTGMSPQSNTVAQLLKGFVSRGTLYPPLKPNLVRETVKALLICPGRQADNVLEVQPSRSLADAGGSETCAGTVRCTRVERST